MGFDLAGTGFSSTFINQIKQVNPAGVRLPAIVISNFAALANQYNLATQANDTHDFALNASRILGAHTLRFGIGYRVLRQNLNSLGQSAGLFNFSTSGACGRPGLSTPRPPRRSGRILPSFCMACRPVPATRPPPTMRSKREPRPFTSKTTGKSAPS